MSADLPLVPHLAGISAILVTLKEHGGLLEAELFGVCEKYGIRAGAIPWPAVLARTVKFKLVQKTPPQVKLSDLGLTLCELLAPGELPPTEPFARAMAVFELGQSDRKSMLAQARFAGDGDRFTDPRGIATDVLDLMIPHGLVTRAGDDWALGGTPFDPLTVGLMLGRPGGSPAADETGKLGELLSLRYYREQGSHALQVSLVSAHFGFDIFLRHNPPDAVRPCAVEAKGTTAIDDLPINLSGHELKVARRLGTRYVVVLWGELRLTDSVEANYERLRRRGYPREFVDPVRILAAKHPGLFDGVETDMGLAVPEGLRLKLPFLRSETPVWPFLLPSAVAA